MINRGHVLIQRQKYVEICTKKVLILCLTLREFGKNDVRERGVLSHIKPVMSQNPGVILLLLFFWVRE